VAIELVRYSMLDRVDLVRVHFFSDKMPKRFTTAKSSLPSVGRIAPESARGGPSLQLAAKLRSSSRWQKARRRHLSAHPLCLDPFNEHSGPEPARHVHHITPLVVDPKRLTDPSNLASLCIDCHARIEGMERGGKATQAIFEPVGGRGVKSQNGENS
jgi:hypothetical protein